MCQSFDLCRAPPTEISRFEFCLSLDSLNFIFFLASKHNMRAKMIQTKSPSVTEKKKKSQMNRRKNNMANEHCVRKAFCFESKKYAFQNWIMCKCIEECKRAQQFVEMIQRHVFFPISHILWMTGLLSNASKIKFHVSDDATDGHDNELLYFKIKSPI